MRGASRETLERRRKPTVFDYTICDVRVNSYYTVSCVDCKIFQECWRKEGTKGIISHPHELVMGSDWLMT